MWGDDGYIGLKQLWDYFARYCYLPRLLDDSVLQQAIRDGISRLVEPPFAYATGVTKERRFTGLAFRSASSVYFDNESVLVHPEDAQRQIDEDQARADAAKAAAELREGESATVVQPTERTGTVQVEEEEQPPTLTRYYGAVSIDPQRVNREIGLVVEEVIQRLTSLTGCDVEIHLEISARRADGFDEATVRTIGENSRTLRFGSHSFEAD